VASIGDGLKLSGIGDESRLGCCADRHIDNFKLARREASKEALSKVFRDFNVTRATFGQFLARVFVNLGPTLALELGIGDRFRWKPKARGERLEADAFLDRQHAAR
jgi:hypothetical protein